MNPKQDALAVALFDIGAVATGQFKLHSGLISPIYLDLRLLASYPSVLRQTAVCYAEILRQLSFDLLVAAPMAGLPIGTAVSLEMDVPLIYPRQKAKAYGTGKMIEGQWTEGQTAVILDDLITSGDSILQTAKSLQAANLKSHEAIVLIDRQQGGTETLRAQGYTLHAVMTLNEVLTALEKNGRITAEQHQAIVAQLNA